MDEAVTPAREPRMLPRFTPFAIIVAGLCAVLAALVLTNTATTANDERDVVIGQRDAAVATSVGLAEQIRDACASGELDGPVCQRAADVQAQPVPTPGRPGATGATGATGPAPPCMSEPSQCRGPKGDKGDKGDPGPPPPCMFEPRQCRGEDGTDGRDGVDGRDGADSTVAGPKGDTGDRGPEGPPCPPGESRQTVTYGLGGPSGTACVAS